MASLWVITLLFFLSMVFMRGYRSEIGVLTEVDEFIKILKAVTLTVISIILIQFFLPVVPGSRTVMLYFWILSSIVLTISRLLVLRFESFAYRKGIGAKKTLIIGSSAMSQDIVERLIIYPRLGYFYSGTLDDAPPEKLHFHIKDRFKLVGHVEEFELICEQLKIDAVFLVKRDISNKLYRQLTQFCVSSGIELNVLSEPILDQPFRLFRTFDGIPVVSTLDVRQRFLGMVLKRSFDIIVAFLILIIISPIFLFTMLWIRLQSPNGPIFYRQERIGLNGVVFNMIKFRSMIPNAEKLSGPVMVNESGDSRYIKGGQFLRQFSIDELPQLWNVLKGEMSIVGPRPERPFFVEQFSKSLPYFKDRHVVPVGITGWAQINGRSVLTRRPEHKVKYDFYYINNWSFLLDIKICIKTIFVVFSREESY